MELQGFIILIKYRLLIQSSSNVVSIRPTTDIEPLYTTIATVTIKLIVVVAIVLLNLYVVVSAGPRIPPFVLSMHFPDVAVSICVEAVPVVPHELPFYNKAFGR